MASDILLYADEVLRRDWAKYDRSRADPTAGPHRIRGRFREDADIFLNLHPNRSVVEDPRARLHTHDYVEIVYVHRGALHQMLGGQTMTLGEGSIVLLNEGVAHDPWVDGSDEIVVNLGVRTERIRSVLSGLLPDRSGSADCFANALFNRRGGMRPFVTFENSGTLRALLCDMFCEYYREDEYVNRVLATDLIRLMIEFSRSGSTAPEAAPDSGDEQGILRDIRAYLEQNFAAMDMERLSNHFNYSQRQMRRLLRNISDDGLPGLLNKLRIQKACEYIDASALSTGEIAERIGFRDVNYFYQVFKGIVGMSVRDYRHRLK